MSPMRASTMNVTASTPPKNASDLSALGEAAAGYVMSGMHLGLGTGKAANAFVHALAERVHSGLDVVGVPTSEATRTLAEALGIPLTTLDHAGQLNLTVDGADEVDLQMNLIKGLGGALIREKIVAASSHRLVIVVGEEKLVSRLGVKTPLPVEVVPFGLPLCTKRLAALGCEPALRVIKTDANRPFLTDNGNYILDCKFTAIDEPARLDAAILEIPGVVGSGLFVGMAECVLVQHGSDVRIFK